MAYLNPIPEYGEPQAACSNASAAPFEAMEQTQDRLGGPAFVPSLAPGPARSQNQPMRNKHLRLAERLELEASMRAGDTQALVAARLGRATGTISRELALNGGRKV